MKPETSGNGIQGHRAGPGDGEHADQLQDLGGAKALPYAGSMSRTSKESSTDLYYDDDLYAQIKNVMRRGRGDCTWPRCRWTAWPALGLGDYDEETANTLEARLQRRRARSTPCAAWWTRSIGLPYYFNYRAVPAHGHPVRQLHHQAGQRDRVRGHHHRRVQAAQRWPASRPAP